MAVNVPNCLAVNKRQRTPCRIKKSPSNSLVAVGNRREQLVRQILEMDKESSNGRYCKWRSGEARQPVVVTAVVSVSPNIIPISSGRVAKIKASQKIQQALQLKTPGRRAMSVPQQTPRSSRSLDSALGVNSGGVRRRSFNVTGVRTTSHRASGKGVLHLRECSVDITKVRVHSVDLRKQADTPREGDSPMSLENGVPSGSTVGEIGVDSPEDTVQLRNGLVITKLKGCDLQSPSNFHSSNQSNHYGSIFHSNNEATSSEADSDEESEECAYEVDYPVSPDIADSPAWIEDSLLPVEQYPVLRSGMEVIPAERLEVESCDVLGSNDPLRVDYGVVPQKDPTGLDHCYTTQDDPSRVHVDLCHARQEDPSTKDQGHVPSPRMQWQCPARTDPCSSRTADMVRVFPVPPQGVYVCPLPADPLHQQFIPANGSKLASPSPPPVLCVTLDRDIGAEV